MVIYHIIHNNISRESLEFKYIRSIFTKLPDDIIKSINDLKKEYLDQQVAALEYAISHKDPWNQDPVAIWKSINTHSIAWCLEFEMPLRTTA